MRRAIKILTLLLTLALLVSAFAVMALATDDCEQEEVNVAPLATPSGIDNDIRTAAYYYALNDGDPLTACPANFVHWGNAYGVYLTFDETYLFSKIVLKTYGVGRVEGSTALTSKLSGKTSEYNIIVTLYDEKGSSAYTITVAAGGKDDIVIELSESIGYVCKVHVAFERRNGSAQGLWEIETYTKEDHNWDYNHPEIKTSATCLANGVKTLTCLDCQAQKDTIIYATGHNTCGACEMGGCAEGTAPTHDCITTCGNDGCKTTVTPAHVKNPNKRCDADCYACGAKDVFTITHVPDTSKACSTDCFYCGEKNVAVANHIANASDMCDNDCVVCGAKDVIPTRYELAVSGANLDSADTNPNKYITHVANPNDPCDTKCANPNCETNQAGYTGPAEVVTAVHKGTECDQTECPSCTKPFYGYKYNTFHVRKTGATNSCSGDCANGHSSKMYWAHEYETCTDFTSKCSICKSGAPTDERRHQFTTKSPYTCVNSGCIYTNGSATCIEHVYTNRCDQVCNVCGNKGAKNWLDGSKIDVDYWHCYQNSCDTTCEDCGAERTITHTYPEADCGRLCIVCGHERPATGVAHTYSNVEGALTADSSACDTECDACHETREVPHDFPTKCYKKCRICNMDNPSIEHTYTDDCDSDCNIVGCAGTREAPHKFEFLCGICADCGAENPNAVDHIYGPATCDATCNRGCGFVRTDAKHAYDNAHDATCNREDCGFVRNADNDTAFIPGCKYDNDCDATCNICGATRTPAEHKYDDDADTTCNVCNAQRTVEPAPTPDTSTDDDVGDDKISGGAIAGIVAGSTVVAGGGGFAAWWFIFRRRRI